jgi:outer membrane protein, heavy metal efflux system
VGRIPDNPTEAMSLDGPIYPTFDRTGLGVSGEELAMSRSSRKGKPESACRALAHARGIGPALALAASFIGPQGWTLAAEVHAPRVAQVGLPRDRSEHGMTTDRAPAGLPPAMPEATAAPVGARGLAAGPTANASPILVLSDFEQMALARNPTLRQAAAQLDAARSRSFQAGLYPNPTLGYVQEQIGALGESTPTSRGVVARGKGSPGELVGGFVQQEIITGGKLRLSRAKFAEEANAASWQANAQQLRVLNDVRIRFFEVVAAQRLIAIHRDLVRLNDDAVRTTEELANVGQANEPDLLQAKVEGRRARVALKNAENHHHGNWESLVSLIGAPELRPTLLDDRPLDADAAPLDFDATLANLLCVSPEIQAALAEIRRDQIMVRRERVEPIPNVTVQAIVGHNYEFNITTAGVQASLPLPLFNRNQGTVREAQADLARDHAEHERVALSLRHRLAEVATRFNDARQSVEDFRAESLPMARRAYDLQLANFRARRAAWPQVLVTQRTYVELDREYVHSLLELRRAEVEINGLLLSDGLAPPATPTSQGHIEAVPTPR